MPRKSLLFLYAFFCLSSFVTAESNSRKSPVIPLVFEQNEGQGPQQYSYTFRHEEMQGGVVQGGLEFRFPAKSGGDLRTVRLHLLGAENTTPLGVKLLPGKSNYLLGENSARWVRSVPQFARVHMPEIYPGVGLTLYGDGEELEHDFIVSPGAGIDRIAFRMEGADSTSLDDDGALHAHVGNSELSLRRPSAYQMLGDKRQPVAADFVLASDGTVHFKVGTYDTQRELIIDPVFVFSSYLAGTGSDRAAAVATDAAGNIYITGSTTSTDFPLAHAYQSQISGCTQLTRCQDAFVTKLDPTGSTILFSTFIGGPYDDEGEAIAIDGNGNVIVAGVSETSGFPHTGALQPAGCQINWDCFFLASFTPDGSSLNYAGLIGGKRGFSSSTTRMALDSANNVYLTGITGDSSFQLTPGTLAGSVIGYPNDELFVLKVDPQGNLVYSTVVPGNAPSDPGTQNNNFNPYGIVVDAAGRATVAGTAYKGLPTTSGVVGPTFPNSYGTAGFTLRLNPTASAIDFATYLPGTDSASGIATDSSGSFYIVGYTSEANLPVGSNPYQKFPGGTVNCICTGGFVLRLKSDASAITAATYLNGTPAPGEISPPATGISTVVLDGSGNVAVAGMTGAANFPLVNPLVDTWQYTSSSSDMFFAEFNPDLSSLLFSSFLNSTNGIFAGSNLAGITVQGSNLTVVGTSNARDFPTTPGSFESTLPPPASQNSSPVHSFVAKVNLATASGSACLSTHSIEFGRVLALSSGSVKLTITNCGNSPLKITGITSSDPTVTAGHVCSSIASGSNCVETVQFSPAKMQDVSGTLQLGNDGAIATQIIAFHGTGIAAKIQTASVLDLGHAFVGTKNPAIRLPIYNMGTSPLTMSKVTVSGTGFALASNNCAASISMTCSLSISFAPASAGPYAGMLTINSNDPETPVLNVALTGIGDSQYLTPVLTQTNLPVLPVSNAARDFNVQGSNFYPTSVVKVNGASLQTTYINPGSLQATLPANTFSTIGELPITVVNPSPGGPSNSLPLTPYLAVSISAKFLIYDSVGKLLYAAIPDGSYTNANSIVPIDPATGALQSPIAVGKDPNRLAVSADGQYLFVGLAGDHTIQRINLKTKAIEKTYTLPADPSFGKLTVNHMEVVPGTSTSLVASLFRQASPAEGGAAMFNDAGLVNFLPNDYGPQTVSIDNFTFTASGSTIYAYPFSSQSNFFTTLGVDSTGVHVQPQSGNGGTCCNQTSGSMVTSDGTLLYTNSGEVLDPSTQKVLGTYVLPQNRTLFYTSGVVPDNVNKRTFVLDPFNSSGSLEAFDQGTFGYIDQLPFENMNVTAWSNFLRFGTDGFAFTSFDYTGSSPASDSVILLRSSLTGQQTVPTPIIGSLSPASVDAGGASFTLQVTGTHFVPQSLITWNGTALSTTFVQDTLLTAKIPASNIVSAESVQIAVQNPSPGGNSTSLPLLIAAKGATASLSAASLDFGTVTQGTSSTAQTVLLTNGGDEALSISAITGSGDFSQTNTCGSLLASGAACQIWISFAPSAVGARTGVLTIADNAGSGTQTVSLTGTGAAGISIGVASGGSTSTTVSAGGTATYNLSISGIAGTTTLACSGAPQNASCSISPATLTLVAGTPSPFTVTVTTKSQTAAVPGTHAASGSVGWLSLAALPVVLIARRRRLFASIAGLVLVLSVCIGCGGSKSSSGGGPTPPVVTTTPAGTYTLTLTATSGTITTTQTLTLIVQ